MMIAGYGGITEGDVIMPKRGPGDIPLGDPKRRLPRPVDPNDPSGGRGFYPPPEIPLGGGPIGPPKPVIPPRPNNLPPPGPIVPPGSKKLPRPMGGFDPGAFARRLNPQQQADFAALRRNTGGNFQNLGGEAGLMKRYNVKSNMRTPPGPGNAPMEALRNYKY